MPKATIMYALDVKQISIRVGLMLSLILAVLGLFQPIHFDEGVFLSIAREMNEGKTLYVDIFDHKPPGIYWVLSGLVRLTENIQILRLFIVAVNTITALMLVKIMRQFNSLGMSCYWLITFWITVYAYHGYFILTEPFVMLAFTLFLYFFLRSETTGFEKQVWLAGFWLGMAMLFKQTAMLVIIPSHLALYLRPRSNFSFVKANLYFAVGILIPFMGMLGVLHLHGQIPWWWTSSVLFPLASYPASDVGTRWKEYAWVFLPMTPLVLAQLFNWRNITKKNTSFILIILGLIPSLLHRPYHQYWLLVLPFLFVLVAQFKSLQLRWILLLTGWTATMGITLTIYYLLVGVRESEIQRKNLGSASCLNADPQTYWIRSCEIENKFFYNVPGP